jgi:hypothetical protein
MSSARSIKRKYSLSSMTSCNPRNTIDTLWWKIAGIAALALPLSLAASEPLRTNAAASTNLPATMLWAWERAEDLRWLPPDAGVAYIATTIEIESDHIRVRPRAYPLLVRDDTVTIPVVHVDASWRKPPALSSAQKDAIASAVLQAAAQSPSHVVQLDFEVRRSQREFLADVVQSIRSRLPADTALSVTALASWCMGDYWIAGLAADEIVPMAFRMARDDSHIRTFLAEHGRFARDRCQGAIGMATDEPVSAARAGRRYVFSPVPWTPQIWRRLEQRPLD